MADPWNRKSFIISSYDERNKFWYRFTLTEQRVTITPEILMDLKKFVENALQHFPKYFIPTLRCEILGQHLYNLYGILQWLGKKSLGDIMYTYIIESSNPGMGRFSNELTTEQKLVEVDIDDKIRCELARFALLNVLEYALNDCFGQIRNTIKETNNDYQL